MQLHFFWRGKTLKDNTRVHRKKPWGVEKTKKEKIVIEGQSPFFLYINIR